MILPIVPIIKRLFFIALILTACHTAKKTTDKTTGAKGFAGGQPAMNFKHGVNVVGDTQFIYKNGSLKFRIHFKAPVVVAVADKPEKWGYFQFPLISRRSDGSIQAKWNMTRDAIEAYGEETHGAAVSLDEGRTFELTGPAQTTGTVELPNGDKLEVYTPKAIPVKNLRLPPPLGASQENYRKSDFTFYKLNELPESCNGIYFKRLKKGEKEWRLEKATIIDDHAARYSLAGLLPVLFWGDVRLAKDGSLVAGIYPGFYIDEAGVVNPKMGAFFYRSVDNGHTWAIRGRILYRGDRQHDAVALKRMGYTEPAFEILKDGTFLCVLRTTDGAGNGPMYASYSKDMGKTWSQPKVIAPNGVLPRLLQLKNGVTVLSSGRPGVQLRFSTDSRGASWSKPFEMLPYNEEAIIQEQNGLSAAVSCGYTGLLPVSDNRFLIIYADFSFKNNNGEIRKAIKVREVELTP